MLKTLFSYYLAASDKKSSFKFGYFVTMIMLTTLAVVSIVIGECCLSYFLFKHLTHTLEYPISTAWLFISAEFFFQALVALIILAFRVKRSNQIIPEEQGRLHKIASAFIRGFTSTKDTL